MKTSAYQSRKNDLPVVQGSLVIFLHDFYDSVHLYPSILFHDFWSWVSFTIDTLHRYDVPFFIKPHPNQTLASDEAFQDLCRTYPDLRILPSDVNNKQLAEAGIAGAVSVFGTVISEMAYLGVPSISCGDNPHSSFPFCHVASTQAEYEALLKDFRSLQTDRIAMKDQACAFYYMHNLNLPDQALDLRDRSIKLRCDIWFGPARDVKDELSDFEEFLGADSLGRFCRDLINSIVNDHARSCKSPPRPVTSP